MHLFGKDPHDMTYRQWLNCRAWADQYWKNERNKMM